MKDYLGNEITAGMTVKIIRTKPLFGDISVHIPKKNGKGFFKPKVFYKQPKECWECVGEYPVHTINGKLRYTIETDSCSIDMALEHPFFVSQPHIDIITIKGISDEKPLEPLRSEDISMVYLEPKITPTIKD